MFFNTCCNSCWNTWNQCRRSSCGCHSHCCGNSTNTNGTTGGTSNGSTNVIFGYFVPVNVNQGCCQNTCRRCNYYNQSTATTTNGCDVYYARQYGLYPYGGCRSCGYNV
ncbi:MAG: hypothetical protein IJW58_02840 [Clostridia bacterium]|nr:hypothetical protein [Clostridia bacterium]